MIQLIGGLGELVRSSLNIFNIKVPPNFQKTGDQDKCIEVIEAPPTFPTLPRGADVKMTKPLAVVPVTLKLKTILILWECCDA